MTDLAQATQARRTAAGFSKRQSSCRSTRCDASRYKLPHVLWEDQAVPANKPLVDEVVFGMRFGARCMDKGRTLRAAGFSCAADTPNTPSVKPRAQTRAPRISDRSASADTQADLRLIRGFGAAAAATTLLLVPVLPGWTKNVRVEDVASPAMQSGALSLINVFLMLIRWRASHCVVQRLQGPIAPLLPTILIYTQVSGRQTRAGLQTPSACSRLLAIFFVAELIISGSNAQGRRILCFTGGDQPGQRQCICVVKSGKRSPV